MAKLIFYAISIGLVVVFWFWWWKRKELAKKHSTFRLLCIPAIAWALFMLYMGVLFDEVRVIFDSPQATLIVFYTFQIGALWVVAGIGVHFWTNHYPKFVKLSGDDEPDKPEPASGNLEERINKMIDDSKK